MGSERDRGNNRMGQGDQERGWKKVKELVGNKRRPIESLGLDAGQKFNLMITALICSV